LHYHHTDLVHRYRYRYFATKGPVDRRAILSEIVDCIVRQPGRFVKYNNDSGEWCSISKEDAMNKTARAMQYRGRRLVQAATTAGQQVPRFHERQGAGCSMHGHDSPLPRFVAHPTHCIPEDTDTSHANWIPSLWDPDVLLEQYYLACLASRHQMQTEPLYRQVSLDMTGDVTPQPAIRSQVDSTPITGHHRQVSNSDATILIPKEVPAVCKVRSDHYDGTSPVKAFSCPMDDCRVDLPVHFLSDESTVESSRCGLDDDDWCAASLGSFDSGDELDQLHLAADLEW
jgi:hypothetical protein